MLLTKNKTVTSVSDSQAVILCLEYIDDIDVILDEEGNTALFKCLQLYLYKAVQYILSRKPNIHHKGMDGETVLHITAANCSIRFSRLFLEYGVDKESVDAFGRTPLHYAILVNNYKVRRFKVPLVKLFLQFGCNVNVIDNDGRLPLDFVTFGTHSFGYCDCMKIAKILIQHGSKLNSRFNGSTILHEACKIKYCHIGLLKIFITNGADTSIANKDGDTFIITLTKAIQGFLKAERVLKFLSVEEAKGTFTFPKPLMDAIRADEQLRNYEFRCRKEMTILTKTKLSPESYISWVNILESDITTIASYCHMEDLRIGLDSLDFRNFLIFGPELKKLYLASIRRYFAEYHALKFFYSILGGIVSFECIMKIISVMPSKELIKLRKHSVKRN